MRRVAKIRVDVGPIEGWNSARSGYDHRKLQLLGSPPGLRLAELNASSVAGHGSILSGHKYSDSARSEYKPRRQSSSCRRTYTPTPSRKTLPKRMSAKVLLHEVDTSHWLCPECVRSTFEGITLVRIAT
jgi:hypothetical protein